MTNPRHARQRPFRPGEGGAVSVTMLVIGLITVIFAAALLGGGAMFAAKARAYDLAQSAARAGAQQIDLAVYRDTGVLRLDPAGAATATRRFLAAAGATGKVTVTTRRISVTATTTQRTPMLRMFGHSAVRVTATATATPTTAGDQP